MRAFKSKMESDSVLRGMGPHGRSCFDRNQCLPLKPATRIRRNLEHSTLCPDSLSKELLGQDGDEMLARKVVVGPRLQSGSNEFLHRGDHHRSWMGYARDVATGILDFEIGGSGSLGDWFIDFNSEQFGVHVCQKHFLIQCSMLRKPIQGILPQHALGLCYNSRLEQVHCDQSTSPIHDLLVESRFIFCVV